jgi:hypothetical protein
MFRGRKGITIITVFLIGKTLMDQASMRERMLLPCQHQASSYFSFLLFINYFITTGLSERLVLF